MKAGPRDKMTSELAAKTEPARWGRLPDESEDEYSTFRLNQAISMTELRIARARAEGSQAAAGRVLRLLDLLDRLVWLRGETAAVPKWPDWEERHLDELEDEGLYLDEEAVRGEEPTWHLVSCLAERLSANAHSCKRGPSWALVDLLVEALDAALGAEPRS